MYGTREQTNGRVTVVYAFSSTKGKEQRRKFSYLQFTEKARLSHLNVLWCLLLRKMMNVFQTKTSSIFRLMCIFSNSIAH
jgi:hypothetical protein